MQTEPSKADPPKRKRRWFQFSLRTLLIGVTLFAVNAGLWKAFGPPILVGWVQTIDGREELAIGGNLGSLFASILQACIVVGFILPRPRFYDAGDSRICRQRRPERPAEISPGWSPPTAGGTPGHDVIARASPERAAERKRSPDICGQIGGMRSVSSDALSGCW
jgi:hypothetical protein